MSTPRDITHVRPVEGSTTPMTASQAREKEAAEGLEAGAARVARVLDRGIVADRLSVDLPGDLYGEWVPRDQLEVERKAALGFWIDTEFAKERALHTTGDGAAVIGDCVFMVCTKQTKALIDADRRRRFDDLHGKKKKGENKQFTESVEEKLGMPVVDQSSQHQVGEADIMAAVQAAKADPASRPPQQ